MFRRVIKAQSLWGSVWCRETSALSRSGGSLWWLSGSLTIVKKFYVVLKTPGKPEPVIGQFGRSQVERGMRFQRRKKLGRGGQNAGRVFIAPLVVGLAVILFWSQPALANLSCGRLFSVSLLSKSATRVDLPELEIQRDLLGPNVLPAGRQQRKLAEFLSWPKGYELLVLEKPRPGQWLLKSQVQLLAVQVPAKADRDEAAFNIARFYGISRDVVRARLDASPEGVVPISDLLPEFLFEAGRGDWCGASCAYGAFAFHGLEKGRWRKVPSMAKTLRHLRQSFRRVDLESEKLQFGDLLVVWSDRDQAMNRVPLGSTEGLSHLAVYIGDSYVFQKDSGGRYMFARFGLSQIGSERHRAYQGLIAVYRRLAGETEPVRAGMKQQ